MDKGSNLPFMLTDTAIAKNTSRRRLHFATFHLGEDLPQPLARCGVIRQDNINLSPAQKELMTWHCRFCHADMQRIQRLLSKPQLPKGSTERGETVPQFVIPKLKGASDSLTRLVG